MADPKHLEILKKGVVIWNEWRKKNPDIKPDLYKAVLSEMDLSGVNLSGVNLGEAFLSQMDLIGADFDEADLSRAVISKVILRRANLRRANLSGADLSRTILANANFYEADLTGANLSGANLLSVNIIFSNLHEANITRAYMGFAGLDETNLTKSNFEDSIFFYIKISNCDLSQSKGLGSVKHEGPSTIGIDTIFRSKGKIPISFLRGCGIPDDVIKTLLKLAKERAFGFYSCFISYSHKDEIFAEKLKKNLEANNVNCWFFPEDSVWGKDIEENIDRGIRDYDRLVVICSENSLNSEPVLREIERALQKEQSSKEKHKKTQRILFPVIIDEYFYKKWDHYLKPLMLRIVYGDFRDWKDPTKYKEALNKLLEGLKKD